MSVVGRGVGRTGVASPFPDRAEVCVVGAGPAGLALAYALGTAGRDVLLLESGRHAASPEAQELNEGSIRGVPYTGLRQTRHRRVGGTANIWDVEVEHQRLGAKYVPLDPHDFDAWPLTRDELDPFYRDAHTLCGLAPFDYGAAAWSAEGRRPFDLRGTGLTNAVYHFGLADRFPGAVVEEVMSMDSVRLVTSATVTGLILDRSAERVRGVRGVLHGEDPFEVEADVVVLACGAVENARLLLLARRDEALGSPSGRGGRARQTGSDDHPRGSRSDWLGRGFMEHARDFSLSLVPGDPGIFEDALFYDLHPVIEGARVGGRLALTGAAIRDHDLPNASLTLVPSADADASVSRLDRLVRAGARALGDRRRGRYGWSRMAWPARRFDLFRVVVNLEQRPDRRNRIELGNRVDRCGNALPRLVLDWTPEEQAGLERLRARLREWLGDAGLGTLRVVDGRPPDLSAHHHAGTTRMAYGPEEGVTDAHGRVFGVDNLYVAGASLFPTAGFANPTLTVVALALRLARHLAPSRREAGPGSG